VKIQNILLEIRLFLILKNQTRSSKLAARGFLQGEWMV